VLARLTQPAALAPQALPESWDGAGRIAPGCKLVEPQAVGPGTLSTGTPTSRVLTDSVAVALVIVSRRDPTSAEHVSLSERDLAGREVGEAEVPDIQNVVGGDVKVTGKAASASQVTYSGKIPLAFGFSCVQVGVEGGHLSIESVKPGAATSLGLEAPAAAAGSGKGLLSANGLLQLS
jgi:hypothetical protein